MINLLPEDRKQEIRAARTNVILLRYNIATLGALAMLAIISGLFFLVLAENKRTAENANTENTAKTTQYAAIRAQADEYRKNLVTAKQILDKEVVYTDTIFEMANSLPKGAVVDSITLTPDSFGKPTVFTVKVKDYATATELKKRFQNSKVFSNAFYQSITGEAGGSDGYPITVTINATLNKVEK